MSVAVVEFQLRSRRPDAATILSVSPRYTQPPCSTGATFHSVWPSVTSLTCGQLGSTNSCDPAPEVCSTWKQVLLLWHALSASALSVMPCHPS